jgi:hypothetical protein
MSTPAQIPPPPPGYQLDSAQSAVPPPPSGYTLDAENAKPFNPPPTGSIRAADQPTGWRERATRWVDNAMNDVRYGTQITGLGGVLHSMGAQGTSSGQGEAVGDFMASGPLGAMRAAKGQVEMSTPGKFWTGAKDTAAGALEAATIPSAFVAPEGAEAIQGAAGKVLPSGIRQSAGKLFSAIEQDAGKVPVELTNSGEAASRMLDWQGKINPGSIVNKYLQRITSPNKGPITYAEARDWYKVLGNLSAEEASKLPPAVQGDRKMMVGGLKQDIGEAAGQVGRAADYYKAMGDYARAARMSDWLEKYGPVIKKAAIVGAVGPVVGAGAIKLLKLSDLLGSK